MPRTASHQRAVSRNQRVVVLWVVWHSTLVVLFALPSLSNERYRRLTEFKSFFLPCAYLVGLVSIRSSETAVNEPFLFFFESKS